VTGEADGAGRQAEGRSLSLSLGPEHAVYAKGLSFQLSSAQRVTFHAYSVLFITNCTGTGLLDNIVLPVVLVVLTASTSEPFVVHSAKAPQTAYPIVMHSLNSTALDKTTSPAWGAGY